MSTVHTGSLTLWISFTCVDFCAICSKGVLSTFVDGLPVGMNGSPDVAPESVIIDGICPGAACC